jgi:uncharacterized protein (DUF1697 family)
MPLVVFLRGVNVGGHKAFQPSALAKELAEFDAVNVGAAGTFVIRKAVSQKALRAELSRRLPFEAEFMICLGRELTDLASGDAFPAEPSGEGVKQFVSVLAVRPRTLPALPFNQPAGDSWQVKIVAVIGRFALSLQRRVGQRFIYPNEVVEKHLGVSATTRNWNTLSAICDILRGDSNGTR